MQNYELENNNVQISGKAVTGLEFSHQVYGEKFYGFTLAITRDSGTLDNIQIVVSERLLDEDILGKHLKISGQFRSCNQYEDNKNKLILNVFVTSVEELEGESIIEENNICLDGFICKEPIYRTTPFGREITDVLLAVNRSYGKSDYIPCVIWGRNAKYVSKLNIGERLRVSGRIQSRVYNKTLENGDMVAKTAYEVSVQKLQVIK